VEELHGDPTVGPRPKVWTAEDGTLVRLGCGKVKEEVSQIMQRVSVGAA